MDPAGEKQRMEAVRKALKALRTGATKTRIDLFPPNSTISRNIQRQVIHELLHRKVIRKVRESLGRVGTTYQVSDMDGLDGLLKNNLELSDVAFSSRAFPPKEEDERPSAVLVPPVAPTPRPTQSFLELKETPPEAPPPPAKPVEATPAPTPPVALAPAPVQPVTSHALDPASVARTNELLTELVEVMHNALQSFVYVRDQVKELNERMKAMESVMERVDELFKPSGDSNESRASGSH